MRINLNFLYKISNYTLLFFITYYIIEFSEVKHDFVNVVKSDCLHLNRISPKFCIFDSFLQLHDRVIQSIKT